LLSSVFDSICDNSVIAQFFTGGDNHSDDEQFFNGENYSEQNVEDSIFGVKKRSSFEDTSDGDDNSIAEYSTEANKQKRSSTMDDGKSNMGSDSSKKYQTNSTMSIHGKNGENCLETSESDALMELEVEVLLDEIFESVSAEKAKNQRHFRRPY